MGKPSDAAQNAKSPLLPPAKTEHPRGTPAPPASLLHERSALWFSLVSPEFSTRKGLWEEYCELIVNPTSALHVRRLHTSAVMVPNPPETQRNPVEEETVPATPSSVY